MRIIRLDGSPEAVGFLAAAVGDALDGGPAVLPLDETAAPPARVRTPGTANHPTHDTPGGVLVVTSGSTGRPRLVVLPPAALRASAAAVAARLGGPGAGCSRCPPTTSPGSR